MVITSRDCANAVTTRIADVALRLMLAAKEGKPLPKIDETTPLEAGDGPQAGRALSGRATRLSTSRSSDGRLYALPASGGFRVELRAVGDDLIVDDRLAYGHERRGQGRQACTIGKDVYERDADDEAGSRCRRSGRG